MTTGPLPLLRRSLPTAVAIVREVALLGALLVVYLMGRNIIEGQQSLAYLHAERVYRLEQWLRLPSEASVQNFFGEIPNVLRAANEYYVNVHFPLMAIFLTIGVLFRPREEYVWARNLLITMTGLALAIHIIFPLAPPRMFPQWGFIDTMTTIGPSAYDGTAAKVANQFAAMPSLHVGWAVLIAVVVARTGPRWLGILASAHAVVTVLVVVMTANHWWIDGIVGSLLLGIALLLFPRPKISEGGPTAALLSLPRLRKPRELPQGSTA